MLGKNRPLDEDELDFINEYVTRDRAKDSAQAADEQEQLAAFKLVGGTCCCVLLLEKWLGPQSCLAKNSIQAAMGRSSLLNCSW